MPAADGAVSPFGFAGLHGPIALFHPLTQKGTSSDALLYYGIPVRHSSDTPGGTGYWRSSSVPILGSANLLVMSSWSTNLVHSRHH